MADKRSIYQFATGLPTALSLLLMDNPDALATSGYSTEKLSIAELAEFINSSINFTQDLNTTAKTIFGAINELQTGQAGWTDVTGTLASGSTSITLQNAAISSSSTLDVYTDVFGLNPTSISVSSGSVTLTFPAQSSAVNVKVRVT